MQKPATPPNEKSRLEALHRLEILDSPTEAVWNRITQIAATVCETPISLVSLIDENRQWFKANHGLDAEETPRDISFCGHAINDTGPFVVSDARADDRFNDNPLVQDAPDIRFYAGIPIKDPDGLNMGTLCVIDTRPRELTDEQMTTLELLAFQAEELIAIRAAAVELRSLLMDDDAPVQEVAGELANQIARPMVPVLMELMQLRKRVATNDEALASVEAIEEHLYRMLSTLDSVTSTMLGKPV